MRPKFTINLKAIHPTPTRIVLVLVSVLGGVLVSSQWRTRIVRVVNPIQPYTSLTETREALIEEQRRLKEEINTVSSKIEERASKLALTDKLDESIVNQTETAATQAGLTNVHGSGIVVTLDDSLNGALQDQAIAHAADLRDLTSLLIAVGAEAISINDERVITTTSIDCIVNTILVNETRLSNPFVVKAIGDSSKMASVVKDPNVLQDLHSRIITDGVQFKVEEVEDILVSAYNGPLPGIYSEVTL